MDTPTTVDALRDVLRRRFPGTTLLERPDRGCFASGIPALDDALPGGLPRGAITLFSGGPSSGKTALALTFVSEATLAGHAVAWVHLGAFSAPSAAWAGVALDQLLTVRAASEVQALRCADLLVRAGALPLVVLDWAGRSGAGARWMRLQQLVATGRVAVLVLAPPPPEGDPLRFASAVHLAVAWGSAGVFAPGSVVVEVERSRYGPFGRRFTVPVQGADLAPFPLLPELPALGRRRDAEIDPPRRGR